MAGQYHGQKPQTQLPLHPFGDPSSSNQDLRPQYPDIPSEVISKDKLRDLVREVDPELELDPEVEDVMLEVADDFIESVVSFAAQLANHRRKLAADGAAALTVEDVALHLEQNWDIKVAGYGRSDVIVPPPIPPAAHRQRLAIRQKMQQDGL